jgi:copper chaperone CopZ
MSTERDCHVEALDPGTVDRGALERAESVWLSVSDMGCPNCARRVRNALVTTPGVLKAEVYLAGAMATVVYEGEQVGPGDLIRAIEEASEGTRHAYRAEVVPAH